MRDAVIPRRRRCMGLTAFLTSSTSLFPAEEARLIMRCAAMRWVSSIAGLTRTQVLLAEV